MEVPKPQVIPDDLPASFRSVWNWVFALTLNCVEGGGSEDDVREVLNNWSVVRWDMPALNELMSTAMAEAIGHFKRREAAVQIALTTNNTLPRHPDPGVN